MVDQPRKVYFTRYEVAERIGTTAKKVWEMEEAGLIERSQQRRINRHVFTLEQFQRIWDRYVEGGLDNG